MSWYNSPFIALDTETTGLDWSEDRVIQAGLSVFKDGLFVRSKEWLINSGKNSCVEAFTTHGISDEEQFTKGLHPQTVFRLVAQYVECSRFVVIMNAPFDLNFLNSEWARINREVTIPYVVDPLIISRFYEKNRIPSLAKGRRTLKALSERYGINDYPLHSAGHDSRRVGELAIQMGQRYGQLGRSSIPELHKKQRTWHTSWCNDFASFADTKGFFFSRTEWPYEKAGKWQIPDVQLPLGI
jgi:DNA polymerase III subunit epsilon